MSAWLRFGWVVVALGALLMVTESKALARGYDAWGWTGWNFIRDQQASSIAPLNSIAPPSPAPATPIHIPSNYSGPLPTLFPNANVTTVVTSAPAYFTPLVPTPTAVPGGPVYYLPSWFSPASSDASAGSTDTSSVVTPAAQLLPAAPPSSSSTIASSSIAPALGSAPAATPAAVNAYVNLGAGPFKDDATINSTPADAWYNSKNPQVLSLFGGHPSAQQQADFTATVMQRVEQTFQMSHVPVTLTTNPGVPAAHTLSLVSNTSAQLLPSAIGMTYVGGNGFSFLDQQAQAARSLDQLEWITAHNLSHELMLALGVHENFDTTGQFLDARNALWNMMTNPNSAFSADAIKALNLALAQPLNSTVQDQGAQIFASRPVPEPASVLLWTACTGLALTLRYRSRSLRKTA